MMKLSISGNARFLFIPSKKFSLFISHSIFCSLSQFSGLFKNFIPSLKKSKSCLQLKTAKTSVLSFPHVKDNSNSFILIR